MRTSRLDGLAAAAVEARAATDAHDAAFYRGVAQPTAAVRAVVRQRLGRGALDGRLERIAAGLQDLRDALSREPHRAGDLEVRLALAAQLEDLIFARRTECSSHVGQIYAFGHGGASPACACALLRVPNATPVAEGLGRTGAASLHGECTHK